MPYQNINTALSDADMGQIITHADAIQALLPFLVNLTDDEKRKHLKLGPKTAKFLFDVNEILNANPDMAPAFVNKTELENDFDLYIRLQSIALRLHTLLNGVQETQLALEQELMRPALAVYKNIQQAAKANVPGSDACLEKLKPYFKKERKKKK